MEKKFENLNLDKQILKALYNLGYNTPSDVQYEVIPRLINNEDVIVKSKTGSGKTASFSIPICENIKVDKNYIQALIIVPTRELAIQVKNEVSNIGRLKKIRCSAIYGSQPIKEQIIQLKQRVHIVVATPGRVIDHINRNTILLDKINYFIIDEADKMLKKGFIEDMDYIFKNISSKCTKGLFSATIDNDIEYVCSKYIKDTKIIEIKCENNQRVSKIDENIFKVDEKNKYDSLIRIIYSNAPKSLIVFCNTKEQVNKLYKIMKEDKFLVRGLHGDMSQEKRNFTIEDFKKGKFNILVSTDVAGRGIHIDDISLVINYDVPYDKENYIHRIGRTGRRNKSGKSITLVSSKDKKYLDEIESYIGHKIKDLDYIDDELVYKGKIVFSENNKKVLNSINIKKEEKKIHSEVTRLYLNAGKKKKIRVIDIVGALSNIPGLTNEDIGVIEVCDLCSYADILNNKGEMIVKKYKQISIKKKIVKIKKDNSNS